MQLQICIKAATNSIIFQGSEIVTQKQSVSLQSLLNFSSNTNYSLIYQASSDGYKISDFHTKCDTISNTLTVVNTNSSYVFGFFTTKDWGASQMWQSDKEAFLFSLMNRFDNPIKMKILNTEYALRGSPSELNIGFEILIFDDFNVNLNYGWSSSGNSYELPSFVNGSGYLLIDADSSGFFSSEIEVYEVDGEKLTYIF